MHSRHLWISAVINGYYMWACAAKNSETLQKHRKYTLSTWMLPVWVRQDWGCFLFHIQWKSDPPICSIPSLWPPAWKLLGNQNQLLVLIPLSSFWLSVSCLVEFPWTQWPPPLSWHHCALENVPHFLLFLHYYRSSRRAACVGAESFHSISRRSWEVK